jgi:hypothetical protein
MQRRLSLVRAAPRPKALGEPEEAHLVDGALHFREGALDDLVLHGRHAEWAL